MKACCVGMRLHWTCSVCLRPPKNHVLLCFKSVSYALLVGKSAHRCTGMCYRCDGFGHLASDCPNSAAVTDARVCVRCGKTDCPASGGTDWHRVHHGCRQEYSAVDVKHVRCFVCGKQGHFCCEATPLVRLITEFSFQMVTEPGAVPMHAAVHFAHAAWLVLFPACRLWLA